MANYNEHVNQLKIAIENADIAGVRDSINNPPQDDRPWPPHDIENTKILQYTLLISVRFPNIQDVNQIIKLLLNIDNYHPDRAHNAQLLAQQRNEFNLTSLYYITQDEQIDSIDSILTAGFGTDTDAKIKFLNSQSLPNSGKESVLMAQSVPTISSSYPGNIEIVRKLLQHGANVSVDKDRNPIVDRNGRNSIDRLEKQQEFINNQIRLYESKDNLDQETINEYVDQLKESLQLNQDILNLLANARQFETKPSKSAGNKIPNSSRSDGSGSKFNSLQKSRRSRRKSRAKFRGRSRRKSRGRSRRKSRGRSRRKSRAKSHRKSRAKSRVNKRKHRMFSTITRGLSSLGQTIFMDGGRFGMPNDYFDNARMLDTGRGNDRWKRIMSEIQRRRQLSIDKDVADLIRERHIKEERRKAAAEYTPEKIKALHEVAATAIERKDYKNADEIYNNILVHVEEPVTLLMLAFLRMEKAHRYDDALAMYERLLELDPGNPYGLLYSSWLTYLLDKSLARKQNADKRIVDLLRQSPRKNLRALLDFIQNRNISQSQDAIIFLDKTMKKLPSDLLSKSDIRKMRSGIEQHIELFRKRSMPNYTPLIDQSDEITDELIQDDPDDPDELELEGYDD